MVGQLLAGALDRAPVPGRGVAFVERLDHARPHVAVIVHRQAELLDPLAEKRVADRRRPHVNPSPPGAQVESGADHADRAGRLLIGGHAREHYRTGIGLGRCAPKLPLKG